MIPARWQRASYELFAPPWYADKDPAHNADHIRRILARCEEFGQGLPTPRADWLFFLTCFHGLDRRINRDTAFRSSLAACIKRLRSWSVGQAQG